jgi:hypothetical protein
MYRRIVGLFVNSEVGNILKKAVVTYLKILSQYLYGGSDKRTTKKSFRIAGFRAEIWARNVGIQESNV